MNKKVILMQKVRDVIKTGIVLFFLFFYVISFGQNKLSGTYSNLASNQEYYNYYIFKKNGEFEYHSGADLGDDYYGKGNYEIIKDHLILNYNKTESLPASYYTQKIWANSSDTVTLNIRISDLAEKAIPYANIIYKDSLKSNGYNGIIADKDGVAVLKLKKDSNDIKLTFTNVGFKQYHVLISKRYNSDIKIFMAKEGKGIPIINQIDTLKVLELKNDHFKTIDEYKKVTHWRKYNP